MTQKSKRFELKSISTPTFPLKMNSCRKKEGPDWSNAAHSCERSQKSNQRECLSLSVGSHRLIIALNRKIVSYVLLRSNVGISTDVRVIREATAALESVFPLSELTSFISLNRQEKEAQLNGLTNLVTGIRLFNKELGKGGETIERLSDYCTRELVEITALIQEQTKVTEEKIQLYKALLDYKDTTMNAELTDEAADKVRSGLCFQRQYLVYLDALRVILIYV
jgi:hypothetical protein